MTRDMDLFRALLLKVEEQPFGGQQTSIEIPGHSKDELIYHAQLAPRDLLQHVFVFSREPASREA